MKLINLKLNIPINFNFILIKKYNKNILVIFNNELKFNINIKNIKDIKINKNLNTLEYKNNFLNKKLFKINNNFYKFLEKINFYYFSKIKFKGKGYKIGFYKKKKIINFFFGKSHKSIFVINNIKIKKLGKYKFMLLNSNLNKLSKLSSEIVKIKKLNDYTNRGLRKSRQIVIKRKGRKGSFV